MEFNDVKRFSAYVRAIYHSENITEASVAIQAVEAEAKQSHQDLLDVQHGKQFEFDQALLSAVKQHKVQLKTAQSNLQACDQEHQLMIQQLQDKISLLQGTLANQANLPCDAQISAQSSQIQDLHSKVVTAVAENSQM